MGPAPWAAIGVPIDSVGRAGGTERAPGAVRANGLLARLGARDGGDLDVRIRGEERDAETGVIGIDGVLATTEAVRAAVREVAGGGARPLLLGGCCALVPGALAGLRDALGGPPGVVLVDGHVDVYDGQSSPTGEAADMPMSVAMGLGPERWVRAAGGPSADPARYAALGARDPEEAADIDGLLATALADVEVVGPEALRAEGPAAAGARVAARLGEDGRFYVHLDVDVLDEAEMPATDYLMPGGLRWEELAQLLDALCAAPALAGLSLGCLNPEKDPDGVYVERTCALLERALTPSAASGASSASG
jgi:arginase